MTNTVKQRKPKFRKSKSDPSGRVKHDDRGHALWEWHGNREEVNGNLDHLGLAVQDSVPTGDGKRNHDQTAKSAKSPYQVDHSGQDRPRKHRDLRALSRQIAAQRKRAKDKDADRYCRDEPAGVHLE